MANTYKKIATVTVGSGGTTSIQFTNIPNTYTDLVVMASLRHLETGGSAWATIKFTLNGATGSNSQRNLYGLGSSISSNTESTDPTFYLRDNNSTGYSTANTFANMMMYFPNYAGSNAKSFSADYVTENNATSALIGLVALLWNQTSAITSMNFEGYYSGDKFDQYSTVTLYGIKNS